MNRLFGTDGVRGIANKELTAQLAFSLGRAGAFVLAQNSHKPKIVIGKDTRISGDLLEAGLIAGILSIGGEVIKAGVIPTPAIAVLNRQLNADAGIMISASHNPAEFNGIKFFDGKGFKLPDETEDQIQALIESGFVYPEVIGGQVGTVTELSDAHHMYEEFLLSTLVGDLSGLDIVLDCANGAAYHIGPEVFEKAGANVTIIGNDPDGININLNCGSTHMDRLRNEVLERKAHFGLAFDGDADRMLAIDEHGQLVDGDKILTIFACNMKKRNVLHADTVVVTVMSNMGLDVALEAHHCKTVKTQVGDRYVLEEMLKNGYNLGGEQSGHLILLDFNTTGDGILSGLQLASIVKTEGCSLGTLASTMKIMPQVLVNARVNGQRKMEYKQDASIQEEIKRMESTLHKKGRVLIRPSGTEPLVRVMLEGENLEEIQGMAHHLAEMIAEKLQ
jgi:phosphoglucosamine mutase